MGLIFSIPPFSDKMDNYGIHTFALNFFNILFLLNRHVKYRISDDLMYMQICNQYWDNEIIFFVKTINFGSKNVVRFDIETKGP